MASHTTKINPFGNDSVSGETSAALRACRFEAVADELADAARALQRARRSASEITDDCEVWHRVYRIEVQLASVVTAVSNEIAALNDPEAYYG